MADGTVQTSDATGQVRFRLVWHTQQEGQNSFYLWVGLYLDRDYSISYSSTMYGNLNFDGTDYGFSNGGVSGSGTTLLLAIDFHNQPADINGNRGYDRLFATFDLKISYGGHYIGTMTCDTGTIDFGHITHTAPSGAPEWGPTASPSSCLSGDTISIAWGGGGSMGTNASFDHSELQWDWNDSNNWGGVYSAAGFNTTATMPGIPGGRVRFRVRIWNNYTMSDDWVYSNYVNCLGATKFNSVQDFYPDDTSPALKFNVTVYNLSFTDNLVLKASDGTTMLTRSGTKLTDGDNTITMNSAERTTFLNKIPSATSLICHWETTTYNGSSSVGSNSSGDFTGYTQSSTSAPTFSNSAAFTINDSNSTTKTITGTSGDSTVLIKGYSTLVIGPYAGTAKNGASIIRYSCSIANATQSNSDGSAMSLGVISQVGSLACTVTITDSRGYTVQYTKYITITDYTAIQLLTASTYIKRNGYETQTTLVVNGTLSQILVGTTNKNAFGAMQYQFKKTTDSSYPNSGTGAWKTLSPKVTDTTITLPNTDLLGDAVDTHGFLIDNSYNIQIKVTDSLTSYTITLTLSKAIPVITIGNGLVGINNPNPNSAYSLDVTGTIHSSSQGRLLGTTTIRMPDGTDLNTLIGNGYYDIQSPVNGPSEIASGQWVNLHVFCSADSGYLTQIIFGMTNMYGKIYIRVKHNNIWDNWTHVWTGSSDGDGSGLDADMLDGKQLSQIIPTTSENFSNVGNQWFKDTTTGIIIQYGYNEYSVNPNSYLDIGKSYPIVFPHYARAAGVLGWRPSALWDGSTAVGRPMDSNITGAWQVTMHNGSSSVQTFYVWTFAIGC